MKAQTFYPVPALAFTKSFGGANPLPQTLTIATGGTAFNFGVTSSTATGGTWLSVSPGGCCYTTPHVLTVTANPSVALAAGNYSGQVVVTSQSGTVSMTIPVTLTVATGTPFLDNLPGALSFTLKTGRASITSQDLQIRNGGSGTLTWTSTKSTADGGNWLTVSATSGTAPSVATIGILPASLPGGGLVAGTFIGEVTIQAASGSATVPISVVVGDNILTQVNGIAFTKVFGGADPLPQTITAASAGTDFNIGIASANATGGSWLSVAPGGCCYTTPHVFTATVSSSPTLAVGTYTAQIVITSQSGALSITIPVTLTVAPAGGTFLDNLPGQMSFSLQTGGTILTNQDLQVRNGGSGTLNWTVSATTSDANPWLSVSAPSGVAPSYVTVQVSVPNLPNGGLIAGTFVGEIVFQTAGSSVTVPVSVVVGESIFSQINAITFTKVFGGADPLPQTLTIASTNANFNVGITSSNATGGSWLTVSPGGCCYTTPHVFTATVSSSPTLAVGTYTAQIVVTSQSGAMSITIPVTLNVAAASQPYFDNVPGQMSFSLKTGSTNNPPAQTVQIRNAGSGSLDWTLLTSTSDGGNWLTASALSGTAPSSVSIGVTKQNLPGLGLIAGSFTGELVFRTSAGSSVTVAVSVVVGDNILSQVNAISFTKPFGGADPLPQTLTFPSTGTDFNIGVSFSNATGGKWLSVSPAGCCYTTPHVFTATVTASPTLAVGTYTAQIVITTQSGSMSITVPVTLTVGSASQPFFDNVPGQMSFSFVTGAGNPVAQSVQIRNGGSGALNWTLATNTADGGNWLTTSASSGTAPSTVTVGVTASALPGQGLIAGTFSGELVFLSSGGNVTIPVSVVVGANVFVQLGTLTFTKPFGGANPLAQTLNIASTGSNFNFGVTANTATGGNWVSASPAGCCYTTARAITATVNAPATLAAGTYTGQIVFTSQSGSMAMTVTVILNVGTVTTQPSISAVVNGGSLVAGLAPNSWATIFGSNLASTTGDWSNAIVNGNLPTVLNGVSVTVGGQPAYIYFVSPGQINFLAPNIGPGSVAVTVSNTAGTSSTFTATASQYSPAFFLWPNSQAVATRQDYSYAVKAGTFAGVTTVPAKPSDVIILWATGFGPTSPAAPVGVAVPGDQIYSTATVPAITINNLPATVFGAALAPGSAGLYQIAIQVPSTIADGDWPIQANIGGVQSATGIVLSVHH